MRGLYRLLMLVAMLAGIASSAQAETNARAFLDAIYRPYLASNFPGQKLDKADRFFTAAVVQAIDRDRREAALRDEPPVLNGDPFVQAQDWDLRDLAVTVRENGPRATGTVTFSNQGTPCRLTLDLVMTPAGWRIDDIRTAGSSLRTDLKVR